jgi:hypothetical protein
MSPAPYSRAKIAAPDADQAYSHGTRGQSQATAEAVEAHDLPAFLARDSRQLGVRIDRHGMTDGAEHR